MDQIRSLLKKHNGLKTVGDVACRQPSKSGMQQSHAVYSAINKSVKNLNNIVEKKVEDLYTNILNNFNRTVLPSTCKDIDQIKEHELAIEGSSEQPKFLLSTKCNQEMISWRRKKIKVNSKTNLYDKQQDKENIPKPAVPQVIVSKTLMHRSEQKNILLDYREEKPTLYELTPKLPNINKQTVPKSRCIRSYQHHITSAGSSRSLIQISTEKSLPYRFSDVLLRINRHQIDDSTFDFLSFQRYHYQQWDSISKIISKLLSFSKQHKFQDSYLLPQTVIELARKKTPITKAQFLSCFKNIELLLFKCTSKPLRFQGKMGKQRAATKIQTWYRMIKLRIEFKNMLKILKSIRKIQNYWRSYCALKKTRELIRQRSQSIIEKFEEKQRRFKKDWQYIKMSQRVEIHINSMSVDEIKRLTTQRFLQKQNAQITRIFRLRDPLLSIIYVCPFELNEQLISYYQKVLEISQITDAKNRLLFVWPEHNLSSHACVCQRTLYSSKCLKRIKNYIKNKKAYIVPGYPSNSHIRIAEILNVPIYGGLPSQAIYLSSKIGSQKLMHRYLPSIVDIFSLDEVYTSLTTLIRRHPDVERWMFKMNDERNARGNAYFDVKSIRNINSLENHQAQQKGQIEKYLPQRLKIVHKNLFKNFKEYMGCYLSSGGIIEAAPSCSQGKIHTATYIVDIEPDGNINMVNSYDKICWQQKTIGCSYPSSIVIAQEQIDVVARKAYKQGVVGYCSMDFLCYEGNFWSVGVDCYLNDLSAVNFTAEAISTYRNPENKNEVEKPLKFVYCPFLSHDGLAQLQMKTFFHMCRLANVSFDINRRIGSIFIFMDALQSSTISLISFCDNDFGLYTYMCNALDFINGRLSARKPENVDSPRTDYVSFGEIRNQFKMLLKKHAASRKENKQCVV